MISTLLYRYPRLLLIAIILIIAAGVGAYSTLPRLEDPVLKRRVGVITTSYPGAATEQVDLLVTSKIENSVDSIDGIKRLLSRSRPGVSIVTIELADSIDDVDPLWSQVRDKLKQLESQLPEKSKSPEIMIAEMKAYAVMISLTVEAADHGHHGELHDFARELQARINRIPGTESSRLYGAPTKQILVSVEPTVLSTTGLTTASIAKQIQDHFPELPAGQFEHRDEQVILANEQEINSLHPLMELMIQHQPPGAKTALQDLASVSLSRDQYDQTQTIIDGQQAITLCAFVQDDHRVDHWFQTLDFELQQYEKLLPEQISLDIFYSQNHYINHRLENLLVNLAIGVCAVMFIIILMMDFGSAAVIGMMLPLSALMVLIGMRILSIPIHQMSVTGLVIALGLLIDNAIVMVEECRQQLRQSSTKLIAIQNAVRHLAMPLFSSTMTTTLAFLPIAILPGPPGEFVGTIAVSVILAINASLLLALFLVPPLISMTQPLTSSNQSERGLSVPFLRSGYLSCIRVIYRTPVLGILISLILPIMGFLKLNQLPEQFFPASDRAQIQLEIELPIRSSIAETRTAVDRIENILKQYDQITQVCFFLGESAPTFYYNVVPRRRQAPYYAQAFIDIQSNHQAERLVDQLQQEINRVLPETRTVVKQLQQGPPVDAPLEILIHGPDSKILQQLGQELRRVLSEIPYVIFTRSDLEESIPQLKIDFLEHEVSAANLTRKEIVQQLYTNLEGAETHPIMFQSLAYPVVVKRTDAATLLSHGISGLEIHSPVRQPMPQNGHGQLQYGIPFSAIANLVVDTDVGAITRINGENTNEIKAYLKAGVLPHPVLMELISRLKESEFRLPEGYRLEFAGETAARDEAVTNLIADAVVLVGFIVLVILISFRSFRITFIIASVGGLSMGLGPLALYNFGYPFGFMAIVGTMGLIGVAVNDSIVVMAGIRANEMARAGDVNAIASVVCSCTRHVLSTTFTTIAGFTPLILEGGEFWPPLAMTIAGGIGGATVLALVFVPSAYRLIVTIPTKHRDNISS